MPESTTTRLLDALATAGLLTVEQIGAVNDAATSSGVTVGEVLVQRGLVAPADIENVMEEELGIPRVDLTSYAPDDDALLLVPVDTARAYGVLPLFEIEGMLTVAVGGPMEAFRIDDLAAALGLEIEVVLSDLESVLEAIGQYYVSAAPVREGEDAPARDGAFGVEADAGSGGLDTLDPTAPALITADAILGEEPVFDVADFFEAPVVDDAPAVAEVPLDLVTFESVADISPSLEEVVETVAPAGPPAIDLDVLAVADARRVSVLVSEILEHAVGKGANRIHLLPYKEDFFLVYRVGGRLEKIASAPLSMQGALVDGFKSFARLSSVQSFRPALGRVKARISEQDFVVTFSAVPTIAGQRLVLSLGAEKPAPRDLSALGINEAETRALYAMVERGRGILLVAGPVAGGRSSTYYALLQHAAQVGKTVYSVERSVEYEIPAVAQVLVNPGAPVGAESYFAAGMRQDTDVVAIDQMQSVEDVHLAIEAAGLGKLVIATFSGADIVSGVRRMLDLGAEPVSLAAALTLGVGQRLVRVNCPHCSAERFSELTAAIPGAEPGMPSVSGAGCPSCGNTGFQGATGVFEVLPFTEQVRSPIARGASADQIGAAARAAGMRPMIASGLAKVREGLVSPEELNRVLRFTE